ncbi:MAG: FAD-dependent oxidoreductase [Acidobacteria bacterium]|nr:FAD-dependent oxidoreductase [Acidobacteriota bacterium]
MANVLVLGGGFAGVIAAESLAQRLGPGNRISLISRHREFTFFPSLVRLAFGRCGLEDVFFDLIHAMRSQRVELIQAEISHYNPDERYVVIPGGRFEKHVNYDYLVFALGRRLAAERVPGFFEHAHHLLTVGAALKFGEAIKGFHHGHAVIGYCQDARLAVPVYETAFALDRLLRARGERDRVKITIISPEKPGDLLGGAAIFPALQKALNEHGIDFIPDFPVNRVTQMKVWAGNRQRIDYNLLMLIPPFQGTLEARYMGITDSSDYIRVDRHMRVTGAERMYAAGDSVNFPGPKMGHMAVLQGEIAAANLAAEIEGREAEASYDHQLMLVIDEGGKDSIYLHHKLWDEEILDLRQGRFWGWAKQMHARYWPRLHALRPIELAEE